MLFCTEIWVTVTVAGGTPEHDGVICPDNGTTTVSVTTPLAAEAVLMDCVMPAHEHALE